jgi:hypothetical protein
MRLRKLVVPAVVAGAVLAPAPAFADGNNTQCNTNNGVTVCSTDDVDDDGADDGADDGGSGNGGNNNDGDGIVNS